LRMGNRVIAEHYVGFRHAKNSAKKNAAAHRIIANNSTALLVGLCQTLLRYA
jgi:hypothetical protein